MRGLHKTVVSHLLLMSLPGTAGFSQSELDNEDVGGAGVSIPLILTYFMIMKGIQRMNCALPH